PAARRDLLIEAERIRLAVNAAPVIAAGSTGSMPATASLLATIAKLPHGAVVLPGLDTDLDGESWELIGEIKDGGGVVQAPAFGHPQLAMRGLLRRIGMKRDEIVALGASGAREKLTSEARPPARTTARLRRWNSRCCAGRVRAPARRASRTRSRRSAPPGIRCMGRIRASGFPRAISMPRRHWRRGWSSPSHRSKRSAARS